MQVTDTKQVSLSQDEICSAIENFISKHTSLLLCSVLWGIKIIVQVQRRQGTNIALNTASIDTSKAIIDELNR